MPRVKKPKPSPTTLVRIDKDMLEEIRVAAKAQRISMRLLVTQALLAYLSRPAR